MKHFDENGWIKSHQFSRLCDKVGELIVEGLEGYTTLECMLAAKHLVTEVGFRCAAMSAEAYSKALDEQVTNGEE